MRWPLSLLFRGDRDAPSPGADGAAPGAPGAPGEPAPTRPASGAARRRARRPGAASPRSSAPSGETPLTAPTVAFVRDLAGLRPPEPDPPAARPRRGGRRPGRARERDRDAPRRALPRRLPGCAGSRRACRPRGFCLRRGRQRRARSSSSVEPPARPGDGGDAPLRPRRGPEAGAVGFVPPSPRGLAGRGAVRGGDLRWRRRASAPATAPEPARALAPAACRVIAGAGSRCTSTADPMRRASAPAAARSMRPAPARAPAHRIAFDAPSSGQRRGRRPRPTLVACRVARRPRPRAPLARRVAPPGPRGSARRPPERPARRRRLGPASRPHGACARSGSRARPRRRRRSDARPRPRPPSPCSGSPPMPDGRRRRTNLVATGQSGGRRGASGPATARRGPAPPLDARPHVDDDAGPAPRATPDRPTTVERRRAAPGCLARLVDGADVEAGSDPVGPGVASARRAAGARRRRPRRAPTAPARGRRPPPWPPPVSASRSAIQPAPDQRLAPTSTHLGRAGAAPLVVARSLRGSDPLRSGAARRRRPGPRDGSSRRRARAAPLTWRPSRLRRTGRPGLPRRPADHGPGMPVARVASLPRAARPPRRGHREARLGLPSRRHRRIPPPPPRRAGLERHQRFRGLGEVRAGRTPSSARWRSTR